MAESHGGDGHFDRYFTDTVLRLALPRGGGKRSAQPRGASAMSGELVLAMSYGLVLVGARLWIWRRVLKDYRDDNR